MLKLQIDSQWLEPNPLNTQTHRHTDTQTDCYWCGLEMKTLNPGLCVVNYSPCIISAGGQLLNISGSNCVFQHSTLDTGLVCPAPTSVLTVCAQHAGIMVSDPQLLLVGRADKTCDATLCTWYLNTLNFIWDFCARSSCWWKSHVLNSIQKCIWISLEVTFPWSERNEDKIVKGNISVYTLEQ